MYNDHEKDDAINTVVSLAHNLQDLVALREKSEALFVETFDWIKSHPDQSSGEDTKTLAAILKTRARVMSAEAAIRARMEKIPGLTEAVEAVNAAGRAVNNELSAILAA